MATQSQLDELEQYIDGTLTTTDEVGNFLIDEIKNLRGNTSPIAQQLATIDAQVQDLQSQRRTLSKTAELNALGLVQMADKAIDKLKIKDK